MSGLCWSKPAMKAALIVVQTALNDIGRLPVVEDGDTSVLEGVGLRLRLKALGFDVDKMDIDLQWHVYNDLIEAQEALQEALLKGVEDQ